MMKQTRTAAIIGILAAVLVFVAGGCEKAANKAMETAIERAAAQDGNEVKADIDLKSGVFSFRDESGEHTEIRLGEDGSFIVRGAEGEMVASGDEQSFTITGPDGAMTMTTGDKAAVPVGFPADVPVYDGLALNLASAMPGDGAFSIGGTTPDGLDKVSAFYKGALAADGWTEHTAMTQPNVAFMGFAKDDRNLTITIESSTDVTNVMIAVH